MNRGILKSFFSSGLQAIAVQVLGVLFIALAAKVLPAEDFGIIQWANAAALFITTLLSFGLEQVVARRIASSTGSDWAASAFLFHNFLGSILAFGLTIVASYFFPASKEAQYLPLFFAAQALMFLVMPIKQYLNAKHLFTPYGLIALTSNLCKLVLAVVLMKNKTLDIHATGSVLIICALFELLALLLYVRAKTNFRLFFKIKAYKKLLKEAAPQYLSVVFDSSLSRLDVILLGIIGASAVATAEYGFALRAYEVARLPIVIISPIILNVFARMLMTGNRMDEHKETLVGQLYNIEIFAGVVIPLALNILWIPLLDNFFDGKYGAVNADEFMILSVCLPLQFFINLMWTLGFSAKKYRNIATITMMSAILNLVLNMALIPVYGSTGAALANLATALFQTYMYYVVINKHVMRVSLQPLIKYSCTAALAYIAVLYIDMHVVLKLLMAIGGYVATALLMGWIKPSQFSEIKKLIGR